MIAGFTPGPWYVLDCSPIGRLLISSKTSAEAVASNGDDCVIARISLDNRPEDLARNNYYDAELIATAPDMVEALDHYADQLCEGWCEQSPDCAHFEDCGGCLARRVAWKARGGAA